MNFVYDAANIQLVVGRPADNIVTLLRRSGALQHAFIPITLHSAP
jgi:hypothetical protein